VFDRSVFACIVIIGLLRWLFVYAIPGDVRMHLFGYLSLLRDHSLTCSSPDARHTSQLTRRIILPSQPRTPPPPYALPADVCASPDLQDILSD
jgi:hypothetical protein